MDNGITKKRNPAASAMEFLQEKMQGIIRSGSKEEPA